ncbi:MAG: winged helix-turn-helix domain-containing protein [Actinomycetia bacterium]|nr:winged helix-turn-helix domain-containing protein [Actinomycetes bacterium]
MAVSTESLTNLTARRIAIRAHGLAKERPAGRVDKRHVKRVFDDIGLIQIDSVNVITRSHHLVLYSRLGTHGDDILQTLAKSGYLVEGWIHEATLLPARDHHLFHWRRREARDMVGVRPQTRAWVEDHPDLLADIRRQLTERGPLGAGELDQRSRNRGPWWGWDDAKFAIEWLFRTGEVGATRGSQFERTYDLIDRILPDEASREPTDRETAHRELVLLAARHLGVASLADLADYHRLKKTDIRGHVHELVSDGLLREVEIQGWTEPAYMLGVTTNARSVSQSVLVSPFDPLVWYRPRGERLFDFHYRIEIYVPAPKRRFGYYVLPFLHRDAIRARVDLKNDRQSRVLRCKAAWSEATDDDPADTARALAEELRQLAGYLGAEGISLDPVGDLSDSLHNHL